MSTSSCSYIILPQSLYTNFCESTQPEGWVKRISIVAQRLIAWIPPENDRFRDHVTLELMQNPTMLCCSHTFDQSTIEQLEACPMCRDNSLWGMPNLLVKQMIEDWKEAPIPTLDGFREINRDEELAVQIQELARRYIDKGHYDQGLKAYGEALSYTNSLEAYAVIPLLYDMLDEPEKAGLACLNLARYQIEKGQLQEASQTLECAKEMAREPLNIDPVLAGLRLRVNPTKEQIRAAMESAAQQKDLGAARTIYKQVIAVSLYAFDAYKALGPLLEGKEQLCVYIEAAKHAALAGEFVLANDFMTTAERLECPAEMTPEQWRGYAEYITERDIDCTNALEYVKLLAQTNEVNRCP